MEPIIVRKAQQADIPPINVFIIFFLIFILYDLIVEVRSLYLKEVQASCIKMVFTCRYSRTVHNLHIHCRT